MPDTDTLSPAHTGTGSGSSTGSGPAADAGTESIARRIRALLAELFGQDRFISSFPGDLSLREAGVSSTGLVSLLVAMEDAFGFEWDDDLQPEVLRSIDSLAGHVAALRLGD
ncbi:phosphopantetheine-binding protein [Streptomyces sp. NPDC087440]|uniref:phosphopantetheine-binding protein n=1 Tax=Streptomyces sp. NPDC087440 TaxID=3365790 RepID=UPI00380F34F9